MASLSSRFSCKPGIKDKDDCSARAATILAKSASVSGNVEVGAEVVLREGGVDGLGVVEGSGVDRDDDTGVICSVPSTAAEASAASDCCAGVAPSLPPGEGLMLLRSCHVVSFDRGKTWKDRMSFSTAHHWIAFRPLLPVLEDRERLGRRKLALDILLKGRMGGSKQRGVL